MPLQTKIYGINALNFLLSFRQSWRSPILAIIGTMVGAWVGYMTISKLGFIAGFGVPIVLSFYSAKWYLGGIEKRWKLSEAKVLKSMAHIDYFNY